MKTPVVLLVVALGMRTTAQIAPDGGRIATFNGTAQLIFETYSGTPFDLKPLSGANSIDQAEILFAHTETELSYFVIRLAGPTRKGGSGYCGGGQEENLVWIKRSHAALLEVRSILYGSCAVSIDSGQGVRLTKSGLTVTYVSEGRTFVCTYDDAFPGNGLSIVSAIGRQ